LKGISVVINIALIHWGHWHRVSEGLITIGWNWNSRSDIGRVIAVKDWSHRNSARGLINIDKGIRDGFLMSGISLIVIEEREETFQRSCL